MDEVGRANLLHEAVGFAADHFTALARSGFEARAVEDRDVAAMVINQSCCKLDASREMASRVTRSMSPISSCVMTNLLDGKRS